MIERLMRIGWLAGIVAAGFILAGAASARAEAVQTKVGGLTVNGELKIADGRKLSDGVVLMVHGTLAHHAMETIVNLQSILTERGYNTLAVSLNLGVDNRSGMYDCATPHRHRHTDALDDIGAWLDWLAGKGVKDVALFGHSRGGNQAAWFATQHGNPMIKRMVLLAPATWDAERAAASYQNLHKKPLQSSLAEAEALVAAGQGGSMIKGAGLLYCPGADATAASIVSYLAPDRRFDTPTLLREAKIPTLVIAGSADTVVSNLPQSMAGVADAKKIKFTVIAEANHYFLDLVAEDVADAIEAFHAPGG